MFFQDHAGDSKWVAKLLQLFNLALNLALLEVDRVVPLLLQIAVKLLLTVDPLQTEMDPTLPWLTWIFSLQVEELVVLQLVF